MNRRCAIPFLPGLTGRDQTDFTQAEGIARRPRQRKMPHMRRIKGAAEQADEPASFTCCRLDRVQTQSLGLRKTS